MPDEPVRIQAEPLLPTDLVIGHIRWSRELGRPEGNMAAGFLIQAYHYDFKFRDPVMQELPAHLRSKHIVDAWEGRHDDREYRVTFMTDSREPRGYTAEDRDPLAFVNFLEVSLRDGVSWTGGSGSSRMFLIPAEIVFDPPGKIQLLPEIRLFGLLDRPKD